MTNQERKEIQVRDKEEVATKDNEWTREGVYYSPAVDIFETGETLSVVADLPGVQKDNLEVDVKEDVLTIVGHVEQANESYKPLYREYGIGGYRRKFNLSDKIDQSKISAELKDGVLTLTLPKAERLKPRRVEIAVG